MFVAAGQFAVGTFMGKKCRNLRLFDVTGCRRGGVAVGITGGASGPLTIWTQTCQ